MSECGDSMLLKTRQTEVDSLKGLAIIGVMFAHMYFVGRMNSAALDLVSSLQMLFGWCVSAFFFLSGVTSKPINNIADLKLFAVNRFYRLLVPFFIFSVTNKVIVGALQGFGLPLGLPIKLDDVQGLVEFLKAPAGPQLYFLPYLFLVSACTSALCFWIGERYTKVALAFWVIAAYFFVDVPEKGYGADFSLFPIYAYSYLVGVIFPKVYRGLEGGLFGFAVVPIVISAIVHSCAVILYACVPVLIFSLMVRRPSSWLVLKLSIVGKQSSSIFIWHAPFIMPLVSILSSKIFGGGRVLLFRCF
jgi:hypothetical protein